MIRISSAVAALFFLAWVISCAGEAPPPTPAATPTPAAAPTQDIKIWTQTIFHLTPVVVFLLTAGAAIWRFRLFRMGQPAIKIEMEVTSRRSSPSYNALNAVAELTNTGRVVVECTKLVWDVRVLAPYRDGDVEMRIQAYEKHHSVETVPVEFPWNVNYTLSRSGSQISLEPGEVNTVSMSLAIPAWIKAVDVQLALQAPGRPKKVEVAWVARRSLDIVRRHDNEHQDK